MELTADCSEVPPREGKIWGSCEERDWLAFERDARYAAKPFSAIQGYDFMISSFSPCQWYIMLLE